MIGQSCGRRNVAFPGQRGWLLLACYDGVVVGQDYFVQPTTEAIPKLGVVANVHVAGGFYREHALWLARRFKQLATLRQWDQFVIDAVEDQQRAAYPIDESHRVVTVADQPP